MKKDGVILALFYGFCVYIIHFLFYLTKMGISSPFWVFFVLQNLLISQRIWLAGCLNGLEI
ncbi:hypothetical protein [Alysiella crassa]|uniref:hypothetical protein n=1 Tax=Alysiella crassa TaxID=153491 RepID=UPI001FD243E7|nr:hypothetical protein [Alysiella crassa]UOP06258.1 hypothetical protein LVJ80_10630 [Alysiella crassa]